MSSHQLEVVWVKYQAGIFACVRIYYRREGLVVVSDSGDQDSVLRYRRSSDNNLARVRGRQRNPGRGRHRGWDGCGRWSRLGELWECQIEVQLKQGDARRTIGVCLVCLDPVQEEYDLDVIERHVCRIDGEQVIPAVDDWHGLRSIAPYLSADGKSVGYGRSTGSGRPGVNEGRRRQSLGECLALYCYPDKQCCG